LADFGLACQTNAGKKQTEFCGTLEYMAPEIILHESYTFSVDIWSAGMTFYELLTGSHPLQAFTERKLHFLFKKWKKRKATTLQRKSLLLSERKLLGAMLRRTPKNRPTAQHILQNNYFINN
jgi:serine/threonine protein kinase